MSRTIQQENQNKTVLKNNGNRFINTVRLVWPILVTIIIVAVAWGSQYKTVYDTVKIDEKQQLAIEANTRSTTILTTKLTSMTEMMQDIRTEMRADFKELKGLLRHETNGAQD